MSSVSKLSSHFTRRREPSCTSPEESSEKPSTSVRARLEKKLQVRQKTGFTFNFAIDRDADDVQEGEVCGRGNSGERGSFRFDFNPTNTTVGAGTSKESKLRGSGGSANPRAVGDFVVETETRRSQPNGKKKTKKKRVGKKKKGGKRNDKPTEHGLEGFAGKQQPQATTPPAAAAPSTLVAGGNETNDSPRLTAARDFDPKRDPAQELVELNEVGEKTAPETLRPPPGFTLESWKDPALSGEERRRRRFGSGVRNMAAIQRSCYARRALVADGELETVESPARHGGLIRPDRNRVRRFLLSALTSAYHSTAAARYSISRDVYDARNLSRVDYCRVKHLFY
ncbi:unnamed protein product [Pylaiella littoralis]